MAPPSVGDTFPAPGISLHGATPGDAVDLGALIKGKCVVIASVPGAFTPTCNASHLPGFIESSGDLKEAGADEIIFVCPNDAFVTAAWGASLGTAGKVTMLADPHLKLAEALGQVTDATVEGLGGPRAKRFSVVVDAAGKLATANWEPEGGTGLTCSKAGPDLVAAVKKAAGKA